MSSTNSVLNPCCDECGSPDNLQRCSKCKVMLCCSRDHRAAHGESHKAVCNAVAKKRNAMDAEEQKLRNHPGDFVTPTNLFENGVGSF
jgi:hypothetical protein